MRRWRWATVLATVGGLAVGASGPAVASAAPGELDRSFSGDGVVELGPGLASDVLVEPRGRILAVGTAGEPGRRDLAIARLSPSGTPDPAFGGDGVVTIAVGPDGEAERADVALRAYRGRLLVAGVADLAAGDAVAPHLVVARLLEDGRLDPGFASGGVQTLPLPGVRLGEALAIRLLPDGRIAVAVSDGADGALLARLLYGGAPDRSLDGDGLRALDEDLAVVLSGAFDAGGRLLLGGEAFDVELTSATVIERFTAAGEPDVSFADAGALRFAFPRTYVEGATAIALAPDGDVVVGAGPFTPSNSTDSAVARLTAAGDLDPTFATAGRLQLDLARDLPYPILQNDGVLDVAVLPDGRIVAAGYVATLEGAEQQETQPFVLRLQSDGALDRTFGAGGVVAGPAAGRGTAIALQGDGRVVVGFSTGFADDPYGTWGVMRLLGDSADLRLAGSGAPARVAPGSSFTLTLRVTNAGPQTATGVTLTVPAAAGTSVDPVVTRLGTLMPGETATVPVVVRVAADATGTLVLRPALTNAQTTSDPRPYDNRASLRVEVAGPPAAASP